MRLILECHPAIFCLDEGKSYAALRQGSVPHVTPTTLVGFKIPRWTEQLTDEVMVDDGEEDAKRFYYGENLLFLLRDVRDTIVSMFNLGLAPSTWCQLWVPRIINAKVARDHEFRLRYADDLKFIDSCPNPLIGFAALYWKYKTESFFTLRNQGFPVLGISYEGLTNAPQQTLERVTAHLELPFNENLLHHNIFPHTEIENGVAIGNTNPARSIDASSVGQGLTFFSNHDLRIIDHIAAPLQKKLDAFLVTDQLTS